MESNLYVFDTLFLISGDLKIETHNDEFRKLLSVSSFYAGDTLSKGVYLPGKSKDSLGTLIEVHAFGKEAFKWGAWRNDTTFYVNQQNEVVTILPKTFLMPDFLLSVQLVIGVYHRIHRLEIVILKLCLVRIQ